jgi:endonuclease I
MLAAPSPPLQTVVRPPDRASAPALAPAPAAAAAVPRAHAPGALAAREGDPGFEAPGSYYAAAQGKDGVALLRSLHEIISTGHEPKNYDDAREAMFSTIDDPRDANVVTDLYTGRRVEGVASLKSADSKGLTAEHAWPQSRGATEEAKGDLHSLFPVDGGVNTMRSNNPYGEVDTAQWASQPVEGVGELSLLGLDTQGRKVFEPRASMRGDVARAQLYFFTRYFGDRPKRFQMTDFAASLPTLLKWHELDPPSDEERARNEAIFQLQGNRNPFIDHPMYVNRIGFSPSMLRRPARQPGGSDAHAGAALVQE